jgi:hypothetical protein
MENITLLESGKSDSLLFSLRTWFTLLALRANENTDQGIEDKQTTLFVDLQTVLRHLRTDGSCLAQRAA